MKLREIMKKLLTKEYYQDTQESLAKMVEESEEVSFGKPKTYQEVHDKYILLLEKHHHYLNKKRELEIILHTLKANMGTLILLKEKHSKGSLSQEQLDELGWDYSYSGDFSVTTEARKKIFRDADEHVSELTMLIESVKSHIDFVEEKISYINNAGFYVTNYLKLKEMF